MLSLIISTGLILIPVLPVSAASVRASSSSSSARPAETATPAHRAATVAAPAPVVPSLTATKTDSFPDPDNDGKAEPGQTITYTVTITNNGTDATNVVFNDNVDPNTTLVPGSVSAQPVAAGDSYNVLGNVRIQPSAAAGLLANDCDPDNGPSCSSAGLTASGPTASAQGGNVTVNPNGSFSYNPPPGFEGADSFTYTVTDATGKTDTAVASFTVNDVVWFVNNAAAAGGDGRLTSPYNSLAAVNGGGDLDEPADVIFVHEGAGAYAGGIALEDGQRLVGQGTSLDAALASFGIAVPAHSDARPAATNNPTIANASGDVITLANGNAVYAVNAAASAAGSSAVAGNGVGGTTLLNGVNASATGGANGVSLVNFGGLFTAAGGSVACNSSGTAVLINGGATNIGFNGVSVSQSGGRVVDIENRTGGAVAFDATTGVTGSNGTTDAVRVVSNSGGSTVSFAGPVTLNTNAAGARGLVADSTGPFTLSMTNGTNAVSSTGGAAVDIENLAVNLNFATTFSTDSTGRGLRADGVSGTASFGNTAVNNSANTGVLLTTNSAAITFNDLDIAPAVGVRALHATDNTGTLSSSSGVVLTTGATAVEIAGASAASRTPLNFTLTSVSASGGDNGIALTNTNGPGAAVGFVVNGDGADTTPGGNGTGGTISATVGADGATAGVGVMLADADEVTLRRVQLNDHPNFAVRGTNVANFHLEYSTVGGVNGTNPASDEGSIAFNELTGAASVVGSVVGGAIEDNVRVVNTAGTLDRITFDNFTLGQMDTTFGDNGVFLQAQNSAVLKATFQNSNLTSARGDVLQFDLTHTATGELIFNNNTVNNQHTNIVTGGGGVTLSGGGSPAAAPTFTYDIQGNTFRGARGSALLVLMQIGSGSATGRVENNTFGAAGVDRSCSREASCIEVRSEGRAAQTVLVDNNQLRQYGGSNGAIYFEMDGINQGGSTGTIGALNATVTNNLIEEPFLTGARSGVHLNHGASSTDNYSSCADIKNNNGANAGSTNATLGADYLLRQRALTTVRLPGYAGANNDNAAVIAFIQGQNVGAESVFVQNTVSTGGGGFVGGFPCLQPANLITFAEPVNNNSFAEVASASSEANHVDNARPSVEGGFSSNSVFANVLRKVRGGFAYTERAIPFSAVSGADVMPFEATHAAVTTAAPAATFAGGTVNIPVGTLRAGDSVTITFQVVVDDPWTGAQPQVTNQGTVTADGGVSVPTDDPTEPGAADPTVTPILLPPSVSINDATVAEPASGTADMLFTVSLAYAYPQPVTVNFQTAGGGANPATAGTDYTTTSGTATFAAGETVQTVSVPVLADGDASEGSETFLVNLSGATNAVISDGQATGTITDESVASQLIISELRTNGPDGTNDDFVELLNTTDNDITVTASDASAGWSVVKSGADCSDTPVVVGVIPNGTVIPARGNYLLTGSAYSLGGYAAGDAALSADIETNHNVGLFTTANVAGLSSVNRLDAVGFGANTADNCALLREGNTLGAVAGFAVDYSFVRKVSKGLTQDTTDNAADFIVVDTNGTSVGGGNAQNLGAPGPEGLTSPRGPVPCSAATGAALFARELIDPTVSAANAPNVVRDLTSDPPNNSTFGTIDFRRTFTNNTGAPATQLRFRITDLSTFPSPSGEADLRARSSSAVVVSTAGGPKTVQGTTVQTPPFQPNGGGINSTLAAGTISLATPLASGASVNLRFLFGVQQTGDYNVGIVLESSPNASGKDFWKLSGHTENGGHTDGGCNRAPVADAGADQTLECSNGQASATLDAVGSSDPDGDTPLTYEWSENGNPLGTGQSITVSLPVGAHTVTLKVTDPSGDSSEDTVTVNVVDTAAPQVTAPPPVVVYTGPGADSCGTVVTNAQLGNGSATDGCEGALPVNRTGVPAGNFFPVGTTQVTYTATDAAGNTGMATQNVTVIDNTAPVVTPPANVTAPADPGSCSATLNPGSASATDNCSVQSVVGTRSDNQPLNAPYPVGTTTITWTATDASGNTGTAQQTVTVLDTQAPTVSSSVAVTTMGPPHNHALINVGLAATAFDNCFGLGPLQVFVYSDEDDGPAPHSPDATNVGLGSLKLRRERDGGSDGRVYLVVVKATDGSGNTTASCSTVTVPLGNSSASQSAVNAQAAAAASFCSANNGAAPGGFFPVGP